MVAYGDNSNGARHLAIVVVIGLIPAGIAHQKGYSFVRWWIYGTLFFIVALPVALLMTPTTAVIEQGKLREGMKKCPFCAELIQPEANVCKHCGRELNAKPVPTANEQSKLREEVKNCPFCAELIKLDANICNHCGQKLNQPRSTQRIKPMRYRIIGEEVSTHRRVEIPNWEAPDIATAKRLATEVGVRVLRIELMNAPTQSTQEVHRDTTAKKNIEEAKKGKCVAVRNIAIAKPTTPMIDLDVAVKNVVLPIAVLVVVGVVVWAVFGIRAEVDGDRALARAKANFQRIADRIDSQTYSTASSSAATPTKLTLANFDRIRTGMSRYDVGDILGFGWKTVAENEIGQGTDFHVTTEALDWQDGLRIVTCMFQNGKLVQKAQAGLE